MATTVRTAKELGEALKDNESRIVIKGALGDKVLAIEAVGPVAWVIAIGAIGVAIAGVIATVGTGGVGAPAGAALEAFATPALVATLGSVGTATTAIAIGVAGGGVGVLSSMRKYKAERQYGEVVLTRR